MLPVVETVSAYLGDVAVAIVVGKVLLLSFIVAPVLASVLPAEYFGPVVRALFPKYYGLGMMAAALGITSIAALWVVTGIDGNHLLPLGLWAAIFSVEWYCRTPLTPNLNALRDRLKAQESQGPVDRELTSKWEHLHHRSVQLNGAVLLFGLCLVGL